MTPEKINFKNIPVQAGVISKIVQLDVDSNHCFQELDDLIGSDQGVATLVLRVVNSPFYSRGNKVGTIPLAISLLGFNVVRSLALLALSRSLFAQTRNHLFRLHIWQHSLLTAIASQQICRLLGATRQADEAFIAGLMHDTGKVLMFTHKPALYEQVLNRVLAGEPGSMQAECQLFGVDHCQVGREAVREWKLPERFIDYMGTDLSVPPLQVPGDPVLLGLMVANYLLKTAGIGAAAVSTEHEKRAALCALGLDVPLCDQVLQEQFVPGLMESDIYQLCASI